MVSRTSASLLALVAGWCGCGDPADDKVPPAAGAEFISPIRTWLGDEAYDEAGRRLMVDDWDGDGREEVIASAPSTFVYGTDAVRSHGGVYRVSADSPDGLLEEAALGALIGWRNGDGIGYFAAAPGDLTGDGAPDLLVHGIFSEDPLVTMGLYAGPLEGVQDPDAFATRILYERGPDAEGAGVFTRCGDLDGDSASELCTGSNVPSIYDTPEEPWTKAHVFRGPIPAGDVWLQDAEVRLVGRTEDVGGFDLGGGSDVTGDGLADLLVGADLRAARTGGVFVVSDPPDGANDVVDWPLWSGEAPGDYAAAEVVSGGDLDGDGTHDLYIGAHMADGRRGRGYVVTTATGGSLADAFLRLEGSNELDWFGIAAAMGDFDGDGAADLAVGIPRDIYFGFDAPGRVALYLGPLAAGSMTEGDADRVIRASDTPDAFGLELAAGDVDGDGTDELVAAAPFDGTMGESAGAVYLLDPFDLN